MAEAETLIFRCPQCAFDNPHDAIHCGMCGVRLSWTESSDGKKKETKPKKTYDEDMRDGDWDDAMSYSQERWKTHAWPLAFIMVFGLFIQVCFIIAASGTGYEKGIIYSIVAVIVSSFILASGMKVSLSIVRENPPRLSETIIPSLKNLVPVGLTVLFFALMISLMAIAVGAITAPAVTIMDMRHGSPGEGIISVMGIIWIITTGLMVVPVSILLISILLMAVARIVDYGKSPWTAIIWAIERVKDHMLKFVGAGIRAGFAQMIGMAMFGVGLFASIPNAGVIYAGIYEWLRLHGDDPDEY
jgi:hypothetical protein